MKLVDKIKQYISSKSKVVDENENVELLYQSILKELKEYKELYFEEAKKLNGHPHFKTKEVQEKVINLINEDERVLFIRGDWGRTLGFEAAKLKLEDVVLRILDNHDASLIQDDNGKNIGIEAMSTKLFKAVLKALDNHELCCQKSGYWGQTLGMFCAIDGYEEGVLKALDDKEASHLRCSLKGKNIGMYAAENGLNKAVLKALDDYDLSTQRDDEGFNIGTHSAGNCDEEVLIKALDNEEASLQQTYYGQSNIGMLCAQRGFKYATLKALDNYQASVQTNRHGLNIGMLAARSDLEECVLKALDNKEARTQLTYLNKENISSLISSGSFESFSCPSSPVGFGTSINVTFLLTSSCTLVEESFEYISSRSFKTALAYSTSLS